MSISIIIPCKNEENTILKTVNILKKKIKNKIKNYEFIFN